jgi:hypothetical protein
LANTPNLDLENISVLSDTASVYDQIVTEIITKTNNNIAKIDAINISNTGGIDGAVGDGIADDTTAIQTVLSSGGYINFGDSDKIYKVTSTLNIPSDTVIDGNGATINVPSSATSKSVFEINDKSNIVIKNLKIISVADKARVIVDRIGLTSNLVGIHITTYTDGLTKDITIQNVYGESLEYLIKADGELNTFNHNILVENIKTYNCVQPIFTSNVDGFMMRHLDLDQKTDVDGHDHHFYIGDYSNNLEITDVVVRRGATDSAGACSFNIASSNDGTLENINIRNVTFDNINNPTLFSIICVRNITIDGVLADITTAKIPIWFHDVENVLLTNFNISGTIGQLIEGTVDDASYNGLVVLKNSIIDVVMTSSMCSAPNLVIMDNHFTLSSTTSAISFFKYISQAYKMKIENNVFNILAYVNGAEFFDVRVSNGADILISNNTIINSSGTNLAFIIGDSTTEGGTTKFVAVNNRYRGYDAFWYATKVLLVSIDNIDLDNLTEETPTTPSSSVATYSVKNFGAKGDFNGTTGTDDTSAIQSALDGGGYISFDSADSAYMITSPLYVSSNSVIDGCGATIFMPSNAVGYGIFNVVNVSNVTIKNFNLKSTADKTRENLRSGISSNISGINVNTTENNVSKNIKIKNVYCENLEFGINIYSSLYFHKDITIEDFKTYNCCQPIYLKYVDGIILKNLDLDVASDVSGSDHHINFREFTYNVDIKHLTAHRGSTVDGASAFALESSNDNYLENIKITDVNYNGLNTNRIFFLRNVKNCSIDGVFGISTIATCVFYYGGVHNLTLTNLNIKGVISSLVSQFIEYGRPYIVDTNYNNLLTLINSKIDITFTGTIFFGQNINIKDNVFNLSTTSSVTMIKLLANENSTFKIENNLINVLAQPDGVGLFDIREETGVDVLINNNTIINSIGTDLSFIIMDDTTAGGSSKIVFINNLYHGFTNIWYATKILLISVNNNNLDILAEEKSILCSQLGMVTNDLTYAVTNYTKLKTAILAGFKILVDDIYYITGNDSSIVIQIDMVGITDNAKFYGNGTLFNLRSGCSSVNIENIEFENFNDLSFTVVHFYTDITSDLFTVEKINFNKNTIKAKTRLIYFQPSVQSKTVDAIANPWGITRLDICNNKFEETTETSISLWDVPFKNYNISDNNVKNFKDSLISLGCDEDATYPANLLLSMENLIVRDNFVFNDDNCWSGDISWNSASSQYYNFLLAECQTVVYQGNYVEGMKTLYKCALYDAYLSCVNVYVTNNVWKNNVCFYATKENNTLMKAKGNNGVRYFIGNYYSVEKDFVDRLYTQINDASVVLANAWVYWFDADDGITKWVMRDNTLDIYNLRFSSGTTSAKELWIENNTIKCYRSTGYFLLLPNENLNYTGCWHKIRNNTFISTEPYNSSYYLSLFCSNPTQYTDTLNLNILIEGNTFIHPYLGYILYELDANEVILRNNIFRSTNSDLHIAYSTNKINILRNINNKFEAQSNKKVFENMSSVYGEIEENFEIHDYSATDSSSNLNIKIGNVFTGTYTFLKEYEILSPQGIANFSFTFKYWYDSANTVNKVSFTDSNSAEQTYTCGTSEGHSTYVKTTGIVYDTVKITFGNYTGMTYFFLSGIDAEDKIIKVRTRCVKSAT